MAFGTEMRSDHGTGTGGGGISVIDRGLRGDAACKPAVGGDRGLGPAAQRNRQFVPKTQGKAGIAQFLFAKPRVSLVPFAAFALIAQPT